MPKDKVEIFWFSEQPYGHVTDEDVEQYESGRLDFPNSHFDPNEPTYSTTSTTSSTPPPIRTASTASCPTSTTRRTGA